MWTKQKQITYLHEVLSQVRLFRIEGKGGGSKTGQEREKENVKLCKKLPLSLNNKDKVWMTREKYR